MTTPPTRAPVLTAAGGDEGEQRGPQGVPEQDALRAEPLGPRGGDEVALQRGDEVGPQEPHVGGVERDGDVSVGRTNALKWPTGSSRRLTLDAGYGNHRNRSTKKAA